MKKLLLGSSAIIAAVTLSMPASAAEKIKLGLGGKMEQYFGVVSQDDAPGYDPTMTGINTDTEVYFTGASTLDNGLTVGAVIQLEAEGASQGGTNADEQYAYIEGAFGRIRAGEKEGVLSAFAHEAPQYGLADDDVAAFFVPENTLGDDYFQGVDTTLAGEDFASIAYISPTFAGFSFGVSFMPAATGALQANQETDYNNQWEVALAYNGEFAGFEVGADAAYLQAEAPEGIEDDRTAWRAGLILGYAGFQVGGSVLQVSDYQQFGAANALDETTTWNAGVGYQTGPYGVSLVYLTSNGEEVDGGDADYEQISLHGAYEMGPGVTLAAAAFWAEGELAAPTAGADDLSVEGTGGIVGLQLAF